MTPSDLELAPAAVVRIAGFPLARVTDLADTTLAALARDSTTDPNCADHYESAYAASIAVQRATLWTHSAADPAFMRALTLCNPALAGWVPAELPARRNKNARHLETSLYRYLARAVARTEPNGLWSGVALAHFGAADEVREVPAQYHVAPDLAPFQQLFTKLGERPEHRARALWKLNPTLTRGPEGWLFSAPTQGALTPRRLRSNPALDAAIAALTELGRFLPATAAAAVARRTPLPLASAHTLLDQLIAGSVIVGGPAFPRRFTDPWHALTLAGERLLPAEQPAWSSAIAQLHTIADRLAAALSADITAPSANTNSTDITAPGATATADITTTNSIDITATNSTDIAAAIARAQADARSVLITLADALALPLPEPPRAPLRCDLRAPFAVHFGPARRAALTELADEFAAFQAGEGMGGALSPALVKRWVSTPAVELASFTPPPGLRAGATPLCWEEVAAALEPAGPLAARVASWSRRLGAATEVSSGPAVPGEPGSPLGCLLFTFGSSAVAGRPVLRGIVRDATPAFSRVAWLLEPGPVRTLSTWLSGQFEHIAATTRIDQAELLVPGQNPNVLARPDLLPHAIDLWGSEPGSLDARGAVLVTDGHAPLLQLPGRPRPLAVHSLTAATVDPADHAQHLLLLSSLRTPPQIPRGDRVAFHHELTGGHHSPRVRLRSGAVVRTRRTVLAGADLRSLLTTKSAARFARWQQLAAAREWPALLLVRRDDEPTLLVPRDSPLAIEALFEGAAACIHLHVEEFVDAAWISDRHGQRYVAELALPFVRRTHVWSARTVAADQRHAVGA